MPALIIDPKGDMTNLMLTFPDLAPADFEPWVNVEMRGDKGNHSDSAAATASTGSKGRGSNKVARYPSAQRGTDFTIYTPGSDGGIPLSVF